MILLVFRLSRHYWRLALRQLVLPVGMPGESFPYRSDFVYNNVGDGADDIGLIVGKLDVEDFQANQPATVPVYIPLRVVWDVALQAVPGSTVQYFNYRLGPTVNYTQERKWSHYTVGIRSAVIRAMQLAGAPWFVDSDQTLVTRVDIAWEKLPPERELDRWIALTRMLANGEMFKEVLGGDALVSQYRNVTYVRVVGVEELGAAPEGLRRVGVENQDCIVEGGRFRIGAGREVAIHWVTNISPLTKMHGTLGYQLFGSAASFEMLDDMAEVSSGILNHRFLVRAKKVLRGRSHLRFRATSDPDVYSPEIIVPVEVGWSSKLLPRAVGIFLAGAGIVLNMLGVLPDPSLTGLKDFVRLNVSSLDDLRSVIRFTGIALTT